MDTACRIWSTCFILSCGFPFQANAFDSEKRPYSAVEAESAEWKAELEIRSGWWSLQPPKEIDPPMVDTESEDLNPVDRFILKSLKDADLSQAEPADSETLLRRISYVLTGLPAGPEQIDSFREAFEKNPDSAFEALVDELMDSPHFGERFARQWMDVVRYTDTYGYEWDNPAKGSWEYRDYLIRAFNDDVPFDELIREQIAGDLLSDPRINPEAGVNESMIGPMFYHMGEHRHETSLQFNGVHQEMINNKVDAFSKAFLAMTVACARCHDHKIDAISQRDYYALAGVIMSPRWTPRVIDAPGKYDAEINRLKSLRSQIHGQMADLWQENTSQVSAEKIAHWTEENQEEWEELKQEDIRHLFSSILGATDETISEVWIQLVNDWNETSATRQTENAGKFYVVTDFSEPGFPEGWVLEGDGIVHGYVNQGTPVVSLTGDSLINSVLQLGYHTHALSSKLAGAIKLPDQELVEGQFISFELKGDEWAGHIDIPQNAFGNETITFIPPGGPSQWMSIEDRELKNGVTQNYLQITTASLNSNFPPRMGRANVGEIELPAEDDGLNHRSWFSLTGIVTHNEEGTPSDTLALFSTLYSDTQPLSIDEAWQMIEEWFSDSVDRWARDKPFPEDVHLINWLLDQDLLPNSMADSPSIASLVKQYRTVEEQIGFTRSVNSMDERGVPPMDYRINIRGNVHDEGPEIPRNFLGVFEGKHRVNQSKHSGRLELAEYLSSAENPQTARVYVNRVWHWVFGTGLVNTPNDFGKLGDRPSHPELLDWLTNTFKEEGWSTKKLIRSLVLTSTFKQSGKIGSVAAERDPDNRLLHHYPTRRLEAEAIRDSLLSVTGSLDPKFYGPPINPVRSQEDPLKRLLSGPLDGEGRRSIYIEMSIMDPPKFLIGFNLPIPKLSTGRRDITNVPAQALLLLNHPFVKEMAERWAKRLVKDGSDSPHERIHGMFRRAFSRPATDSEMQRWAGALDSFVHNDEVMIDQAAWTELAHALFNTKEFIYYR